ncbi:MAG: DUF393 domain-containing protein [Bacteroidetes bacterium]|nr:MAG: DUF393 domain-containing protein [Bacteroidota bacterium]
MEAEKPIVIFDGHCNFCNASVNFILERDHQQAFLFTPNQGDTGKQLLAGHTTPAGTETLYLWENGRLYERSTAVLRIARRLGFPWKLLYGFILIPPFIRDGVYNFIARNRYRWFGRREHCRLPSPAEQARFI